MISATTIWGIAALIYVLFWAWYVGLRGKLSQAEIEHYGQRFTEAGLPVAAQENLRRFLEKDDGREWFMVNVLELKSPKYDSAKLLLSYSKTFMAGMFKRAGHPYFIAVAAAKNVENLNCDHADNWTSTGIVRYRSRRDFAETLLDTFGSAHHADKLAALEKTFAFPATTTLLMGSPRVLVAMGLGLIASLSNLALSNLALSNLALANLVL